MVEQAVEEIEYEALPIGAGYGINMLAGALVCASCARILFSSRSDTRQLGSHFYPSPSDRQGYQNTLSCSQLTVSKYVYLKAPAPWPGGSIRPHRTFPFAQLWIDQDAGVLCITCGCVLRDR